MSDFFNTLLYNKNHLLLYHSVLFFILFSVFYLFYVIAFKSIKTRNIILLLFSLYFYYKLGGLAIFVLLFVATSDYLIGRWMFANSKQHNKKLLLLLSIFINLGLLIYFKYTNFLIESWAGMSGSGDLPVYNIIVPIGISYFIFKTLTYTIGIYREEIQVPEKNYFNYILYVSFFPNILAGPISRASDLLVQFRENISLDEKHVGQGFFLIICGAVKKIFIADFLAGNFVDRVFDAPEYFSGFESFMASYGYTVQLYFDFSGYTDIVIGIACLLGFSVLPNFNKPFSAVNITDFWRRWHLTLSSWLRDYLYTPLSLNFRGMQNFGAFLAILITFVICGFWHGASLTFIIWGAVHGLAMGWDIITHKLRARIRKRSNPRIYRFVSILITFHFLCFSFILFRSQNIASALTMYEKIFTSLDFGLASQWVGLYIYPFLILIAGLLLHYTPMKWNNGLLNTFTRLHWSLKAVVVAVSFIIIYQVFSAASQPFIYLEF